MVKIRAADKRSSSNNNISPSTSSWTSRSAKRRQKHILLLTLVILCLPALYINGFFDSGALKQLQGGQFQNKGAIIQTTTTTTNTRKRGKNGKLFYSKDQLVNEECQQTEEVLDVIANRWSNRPHPRSDIQSLFNCDLRDAYCTYYYPANFLDKNCGLGKEFASHVEVAKAKHSNGTLWNFQQAIGFPTLTIENLCINDTASATPTGKSKLMQPSKVGKRPSTGINLQSEKDLINIGEKTQHVGDDAIRCITERLSFLHVHKAGGSSLHEAFNSIARNNHDHAAIVRHKHFSPSDRPGIVDKTNPANTDGMRIFTSLALEDATRYPAVDQYNSRQHVIFAAVREPTERFISSIGQALGGFGSNRNHIGQELIKLCVKSTSRETLTCLAKYVRDHGYWIELHFTPQVIDIGFTTMWQDVPIAIFPMKPHLQSILTYLGIPDVQVRDGSSEHYRSHQVLKDMTVDDYDEESLSIVCKIYEMDVQMQRSLGMEVPRCDPYIPKDYRFEI